MKTTPTDSSLELSATLLGLLALVAAIAVYKYGAAWGLINPGRCALGFVIGGIGFLRASLDVREYDYFYGISGGLIGLGIGASPESLSADWHNLKSLTLSVVAAAGGVLSFLAASKR